MRNFNGILRDITLAFEEHKLEKERNEIEQTIRSGATGGEILMGCTSKLMAMQTADYKISAAAKPLIIELVQYCHSVGLYPKPFEGLKH
jgi:hypothetical protein